MEMVSFYRKLYFTFVTIVAITLSIIIYQVYLVQNNSTLYRSGVPIILWWTPFGNDGISRDCGNYQCYFTSNRSYQYHKEIKSFLFYGSNFQVGDLPSWKSDKVPWGLFHEESPRNNPILVHDETLNLFKYSSTFSRFSDVPLTLVDLPGIRELLDRKHFVPTKEKSRLIREKNLAPLLYIQSDCNTASNRDVYVAELMRHIRVDSYGTCLNNAQFDKRLKENYLEVLNSEDFLSFIANYKFTIAFENAVCDDYITEKLWRPLIIGSVPVYYGSPTFKDWLPNNESAISVHDFEGPASLAKFLQNLSDNEVEYDKYLSHKLIDNYKIDNERLRKALNRREQWSSNEFVNYVEEFECFVCEHVQMTEATKIVEKKHYDCPLPENPLTNKLDDSNWWTQQWILEKCGAKILTHHVRNNFTIDIGNFENDKYKLYDKNEC
ncbi:alpha-(1,3)-fucosyltransferase 10 [Ceratina calcarata]|uniref:Fucosyltransferase n=1 Tax=Ceratina calcarata TaxID=156304 RepID=A0AAJ7JH29_9HYME|nr:alpha-(1,3)-fucosyltransferase 10 [Ceratina calcarata]XP_026675400.1 alpha-(1,3)-fucosyltransferase 10 [Ceratina calcarata]XP_026675401.1 alpha-(1,3)-fucosyltransferase 10 [Ceratina calcarata]